MADLEKIAEDLSALTVLEAAELSKLLEEKWGVAGRPCGCPLGCVCIGTFQYLASRWGEVTRR